MPRFEHHIFICVNERAPGHPKGSCGPAGGDAVCARFKSQLKERGLGSKVRANRAGCLDACEAGVTVVVYPDGVWYGRVTPDDVDTIIDEHIIGGRPVGRLRIPESYFELGPAAKMEYWTVGRRDASGSA